MRTYWSRTLLFIGIALVLAGIAVIAVPVAAVFNRGAAGNNALYAWQHGGEKNITGAVKGTVAPIPATVCSASNAPPADYALVTFPVTGGVSYAGVATNGTWAQLLTMPMVHYVTSPAPGQPGNVIIGFHREPQYQNINQMRVGQLVKIETRNCATYTYRITGAWDETPSQVTQLVPTTGSQLTLITCTPWWVDTHRLVWRATLIGSTPG